MGLGGASCSRSGPVPNPTRPPSHSELNRGRGAAYAPLTLFPDVAARPGPVLNPTWGAGPCRLYSELDRRTTSETRPPPPPSGPIRNPTIPFHARPRPQSHSELDRRTTTGAGPFESSPRGGLPAADQGRSPVRSRSEPDQAPCRSYSEFDRAPPSPSPIRNPTGNYERTRSRPPTFTTKVLLQGPSRVPPTATTRNSRIPTPDLHYHRTGVGGDRPPRPFPFPTRTPPSVPTKVLPTTAALNHGGGARFTRPYPFP